MHCDATLSGARRSSRSELHPCGAHRRIRIGHPDRDRCDGEHGQVVGGVTDREDSLVLDAQLGNRRSQARALVAALGRERNRRLVDDQVAPAAGGRAHCLDRRDPSRGGADHDVAHVELGHSGGEQTGHDSRLDRLAGGHVHQHAALLAHGSIAQTDHGGHHLPQALPPPAGDDDQRVTIGAGPLQRQCRRLGYHPAVVQGAVDVERDHHLFHGAVLAGRGMDVWAWPKRGTVHRRNAARDFALPPSGRTDGQGTTSTSRRTRGTMWSVI